MSVRKVYRLAIILAFVIWHLSFGISSAHAQQEPGVEGWYCVGTQPGTIWHQIPSLDPNIGDTQIQQEDCGANEQCVAIPPPNDTYFGDAACEPTNQPPSKGTGTSMFIPVNPVTQGDPVKINITSNKNLPPDCHSDVTADDIKVFGRLNACQVVQQTDPVTGQLADTICGCDQKHVCHNVDEHNDPLNPSKVTGHHQDCSQIVDCGPSDWHTGSGTDPVSGKTLGINPNDNRQCLTVISCTSNSIGTYDIPFRPANTACWNDASVNVATPTAAGPIPLPTKDCVKSAQNIAAPVRDNNILADSLQDDLDNTQKLAILLPDGVNSDLNNAHSTPDPFTGVERSFLTNLACALKDLPVFGGLFANLCPKDVKFMNSQTSYLTQISMAVENRTRPDSFQPPAQTQACEIIDFGQPSTVGNKDTSSISTQLGGPQGTYSQDTPDIIPINTDQTQNLYTEGKVFDSDKRVPDINARCKEYSGANLPDGISFCNDQSITPP